LLCARKWAYRRSGVFHIIAACMTNRSQMRHREDRTARRRTQDPPPEATADSRPQIPIDYEAVLRNPAAGSFSSS
jgi:hypothetical protein